MEYKYNTQEEVRKHEIRRKRHIVGVKAFIVGSALTAVGFIIGGAITKDPEDLTMSEITKELTIHTGHEITPDGHVMSYADEHHCDVPMDEAKTPFIERVTTRMSSQYPPEAIEEVRACYEAMYHGNHEDFEAAVDRLDELDDQLVKDENGNYNFVRKTAGLH